MPRYIDADALYKELCEEMGFDEAERFNDYYLGEIPTADVVEVVRCKNCSKKEYCRTSNVWAVLLSDDWFCADGERREDET